MILNYCYMIVSLCNRGPKKSRRRGEGESTLLRNGDINLSVSAVGGRHRFRSILKFELPGNPSLIALPRYVLQNWGHEIGLLA